MQRSIKSLEEEIELLNREFSILGAVSQTVNQSIDLHEILNNSLDQIKELTGIGSVCFYILEEKDGILTLTAQRGFSKAFLKGVRTLRLGEGVTGRVAVSGEPAFIEEFPTYPGNIPLAIDEGVKSLIVIPLKSKNKIYGTLNVAWKDFHRFNSFEKNLFNSIGQIIGSAMERASLYTENVKRLEEQNTLSSISQEIASRLELKVILQKIMEKVIELLGVEAGQITLWDNRKQNYAVAIVHNLPESMVGTEITPSTGGIVGEICSKKGPVVYEDYEHHPNRSKMLDAYHFKEVVGVPLAVRHMIIGTMVVGTSDPKKHFQQGEIDLLNNFAQQAAIAIGNARLYEDSLEKIKRLTTLYEIGKALSSTLDLDELLLKALELLKDLLGYDKSSFLFLDEVKNELYIKQIIGKKLEEVKEKRFRVGVDGIVGWVAHTGEAVYVPDVSKDPRYIRGLPEGNSEAVFPLKVHDQLIGIMDVESRELRGFDEEDLKVLSSFASQVSISIENAQLFAELRRTLKELRQAQDQIIQAEKLRALGEMASGVAHDFNNVLAVILGNIQLLLFQLDRVSSEEIREQLRVIESASRDGAETIRRIQEFTGIRRDREFTALSINEILREVVTVTQPRWRDQAQSKGIQIELHSQLEGNPLVFGNPSELREVLTNIIFNAVDAMPGGGSITLEAQPQTDCVEVRISDTGMGMTEDVKKRVFDPFFTTKGVTNSGLGMSVSYGIIKRHGGEILIESELDKGTTFIIHLPLIPMEEDSEKESAPEQEARPARILVIDDEDSIRNLLSRMLQTKGHQVVVASSGEEGIELFQSQSFDIVFTDLGMSKMTGWEVGKTIKTLNPRTPIAMITGWGMELNREKMQESGIDLVVPKPFNYVQVLQLVSEALELKERM